MLFAIRAARSAVFFSQPERVASAAEAARALRKGGLQAAAAAFRPPRPPQAAPSSLSAGGGGDRGVAGDSSANGGELHEVGDHAAKAAVFAPPKAPSSGAEDEKDAADYPRAGDGLRMDAAAAPAWPQPAQPVALPPMANDEADGDLPSEQQAEQLMTKAAADGSSVADENEERQFPPQLQQRDQGIADAAQGEPASALEKPATGQKGSWWQRWLPSAATAESPATGSDAGAPASAEASSARSAAEELPTTHSDVAQRRSSALSAARMLIEQPFRVEHHAAAAAAAAADGADASTQSGWPLARQLQSLLRTGAPDQQLLPSPDDGKLASVLAQAPFLAVPGSSGSEADPSHGSADADGSSGGFVAHASSGAAGGLGSTGASDAEAASAARKAMESRLQRLMRRAAKLEAREEEEEAEAEAGDAEQGGDAADANGNSMGAAGSDLDEADQNEDEDGDAVIDDDDEDEDAYPSTSASTKQQPMPTPHPLSLDDGVFTGSVGGRMPVSLILSAYDANADAATHAAAVASEVAFGQAVRGALHMRTLGLCSAAAAAQGGGSSGAGKGGSGSGPGGAASGNGAAQGSSSGSGFATAGRAGAGAAGLNDPLASTSVGGRPGAGAGVGGGSTGAAGSSAGSAAAAGSGANSQGVAGRGTSGAGSTAGGVAANGAAGRGSPAGAPSAPQSMAGRNSAGNSVGAGGASNGGASSAGNAGAGAVSAAPAAEDDSPIAQAALQRRSAAEQLLLALQGAGPAPDAISGTPRRAAAFARAARALRYDTTAPGLRMLPALLGALRSAAGAATAAGGAGISTSEQQLQAINASLWGVAAMCGDDAAATEFSRNARVDADGEENDDGDDDVVVAALNALAAALPPGRRPFLSHSGELELGSGPVMVLGAGAGHLSLRLAQALPNNTVLGVCWASGGGPSARLASASAGGAASGSGTGSGSSSDGEDATAAEAGAGAGSPADGDLLSSCELASSLKRSIGVPNAWFAEVPVDPHMPLPASLQLLPSAGSAGSSSAGFSAEDDGAGGDSGDSSWARITEYLQSRLSRDGGAAAGLARFADADPAGLWRGFGIGDAPGKPGSSAGTDARSGSGSGAASALASSSAGFSLGLLVLPDLARLWRGDELPHELEASLGRLLTLSRHVMLPARLPDAASLAHNPAFARMPVSLSTGKSAGSGDTAGEAADGAGDEGEDGSSAGNGVGGACVQCSERAARAARFFAYWDSVDALVEGAVRSVGLTGTVRPLGSYSLGGAAAAPQTQGGANNGGGSSGGSTSMLLLTLQRVEEAEAEEALYAAVDAMGDDGDDAAADNSGPAAKRSGSAAGSAPRGGGAVRGRGSDSGAKPSSVSTQRGESTAAGASSAAAGTGAGAVNGPWAGALARLMLTDPLALRSSLPLASAYARLAQYAPQGQGDGSGDGAGDDGSGTDGSSAGGGGDCRRLGGLAAAASTALAGPHPLSRALLQLAPLAGAPVVPPEIASAVGVPLDVALSLGLHPHDAAELARQALALLPARAGSADAASLCAAAPAASADRADGDASEEAARLCAMDALLQHSDASRLYIVGSRLVLLGAPLPASTLTAPASLAAALAAQLPALAAGSTGAGPSSASSGPGAASQQRPQLSISSIDSKPRTEPAADAPSLRRIADAAGTGMSARPQSESKAGSQKADPAAQAARPVFAPPLPPSEDDKAARAALPAIRRPPFAAAAAPPLAPASASRPAVLPGQVQPQARNMPASGASALRAAANGQDEALAAGSAGKRKADIGMSQAQQPPVAGSAAKDGFRRGGKLVPQEQAPQEEDAAADGEADADELPEDELPEDRAGDGDEEVDVTGAAGMAESEAGAGDGEDEADAEADEAGFDGADDADAEEAADGEEAQGEEDAGDAVEQTLDEPAPAAGLRRGRQLLESVRRGRDRVAQAVAGTLRKPATWAQLRPILPPTAFHGTSSSSSSSGSAVNYRSPAASASASSARAQRDRERARRQQLQSALVASEGSALQAWWQWLASSRPVHGITALGSHAAAAADAPGAAENYALPAEAGAADVVLLSGSQSTLLAAKISRALERAGRVSRGSGAGAAAGAAGLVVTAHAGMSAGLASAGERPEAAFAARTAAAVVSGDASGSSSATSGSGDLASAAAQLWPYWGSAHVSSPGPGAKTAAAAASLPDAATLSRRIAAASSADRRKAIDAASPAAAHGALSALLGTQNDVTVAAPLTTHRLKTLLLGALGSAGAAAGMAAAAARDGSPTQALPLPFSPPFDLAIHTGSDGAAADVHVLADSLLLLEQGLLAAAATSSATSANAKAGGAWFAPSAAAVTGEALLSAWADRIAALLAAARVTGLQLPSLQRLTHTLRVFAVGRHYCHAVGSAFSASAAAPGNRRGDGTAPGRLARLPLPCALVSGSAVPAQWRAGSGGSASVAHSAAASAINALSAVLLSLPAPSASAGAAAGAGRAGAAAVPAGGRGLALPGPAGGHAPALGSSSIGIAVYGASHAAGDASSSSGDAVRAAAATRHALHSALDRAFARIVAQPAPWWVSTAMRKPRPSHSSARGTAPGSHDDGGLDDGSIWTDVDSIERAGAGTSAGDGVTPGSFADFGGISGSGSGSEDEDPLAELLGLASPAIRQRGSSGSRPAGAGASDRALALPMTRQQRSGSRGHTSTPAPPTAWTPAPRLGVQPLAAASAAARSALAASAPVLCDGFVSAALAAAVAKVERRGAALLQRIESSSTGMRVPISLLVPAAASVSSSLSSSPSDADIPSTLLLARPWLGLLSLALDDTAALTARARIAVQAIGLVNSLSGDHHDAAADAGASGAAAASPALLVTIAREIAATSASTSTSTAVGAGSAARLGLSMHALLALHPPPALSSRLFAMALALPLPSIARAAHAAGFNIGMGPGMQQPLAGAAPSPAFQIAPWSMHLVPDAHPLCRARIGIIVPSKASSTAAAAAASTGSDAAGTLFLSQACLAAVTESVPGALPAPRPLLPTSLQAAVSAGELRVGSDADEGLRERWAALASQLTPLDTASGGLQLPAAPSEAGAAPLSAADMAAAIAAAEAAARGRFSFVEFASGTGATSLLLARAFPNATVLSVEGDEDATNAHLAAALRGGIANAIIGRSTVDASLLRAVHDSPEFFRYQSLGRSLMSLLASSSSSSSGGGVMVTAAPAIQPGGGINGRNAWAAAAAAAATSGQGGAGSSSSSGNSNSDPLRDASVFLRTLAGLAATSFVPAPPAAALSLALTLWMDWSPSLAASVVLAPAHSRSQTASDAAAGAPAFAALLHAAQGVLSGTASAAFAAGGAATLPGTRYTVPLLDDHAVMQHSHVGGSCPSLWRTSSAASAAAAAAGPASGLLLCPGSADGAAGPLGFGAPALTRDLLSAATTTPDVAQPDAAAGLTPSGAAVAAAVLRALGARYALHQHPRPPLARAETRLLAELLGSAAPSANARRGKASGRTAGAPDSIVDVTAAAIPALLALPSTVDDIAPGRPPLMQLSFAAAAGAAVNAAAGASTSAASAALAKLATPSVPLLPPGISSGLLRVDVRRLVRHVGHHFRSDIDGHTRKYTLHVQANVTAGAVLARLLGQHGIADIRDVHATVAAAATTAAAANPGKGGRGGAGASPLGLSGIYGALEPGNHPNHGLSLLGDATAILDAAAATAAEEAAAEAARQARLALAAGPAKGTGKKSKRNGRGKGKAPAYKAAPSGGSGSSKAADLPPFPDVAAQISRGAALLLRKKSGTSAAAGRASIGKQPRSASGGAAAALQQQTEVQVQQLLPGVTSIILTRDMDGAFIPYDSVHGITLIALLRLGLLPPLRTRAYHQFVSLPLYLDMAPWNIVSRGGNLDYIDFDTKDRTFDGAVAGAYQAMEVLFNYKRTLEDLKRCGGKGSNPYNFPFVSECVGPGGGAGGGGLPAPPPDLKCSDSRAPVPCGDGTCHSDYVSCLRSLSRTERLADGRKTLGWALTEYASAAAGQGRAGSGSDGGDGAGASAADFNAAAGKAQQRGRAGAGPARSQAGRPGSRDAGRTRLSMREALADEDDGSGNTGSRLGGAASRGRLGAAEAHRLAREFLGLGGGSGQQLSEMDGAEDNDDGVDVDEFSTGGGNGGARQSVGKGAAATRNDGLPFQEPAGAALRFGGAAA